MAQRVKQNEVAVEAGLRRNKLRPKPRDCLDKTLDEKIKARHLCADSVARSKGSPSPPSPIYSLLKTIPIGKRFAKAKPSIYSKKHSPQKISRKKMVDSEMISNAEAPRRPPVVIFLHWTTLAALLLGILLILLRECFDGRAVRYWMLEAHRHMGLLVFCLLLVRLTVRSVLYRLPAIDQTSRFVRAVATVTHMVLYLLLACVPLLGWISSNARDQTVHFLGIPLPALANMDDDLADSLTDWHSYAAWSLLTLGLVHALAALWHHFIRRDQILVAMLPQWRNRSSDKE